MRLASSERWIPFLVLYLKGRTHWVRLFRSYRTVYNPNQFYKKKQNGEQFLFILIWQNFSLLVFQRKKHFDTFCLFIIIVSDIKCILNLWIWQTAPIPFLSQVCYSHCLLRSCEILVANCSGSYTDRKEDRFFFKKCVWYWARCIMYIISATFFWKCHFLHLTKWEHCIQYSKEYCNWF